MLYFVIMIFPLGSCSLPIVVVSLKTKHANRTQKVCSTVTLLDSAECPVHTNEEIIPRLPSFHSQKCPLAKAVFRCFLFFLRQGSHYKTKHRETNQENRWQISFTRNRDKRRSSTKHFGRYFYFSTLSLTAGTSGFLRCSSCA